MPIKLKRGLDLKIAGGVSTLDISDVAVARCAIYPDDFPGFQPRPAIKEGELLAVGDAVAFDKRHQQVQLVSPIAGRLKAIVRGERRKIIRFEIEAEGDSIYRKFSVPVGPDKLTAATFLAESGLLAMLRTRPYDIVPDPEVAPRDIFVTCIDSAPLSVSAVTLAYSADKSAGAKIKAAVTLLKTCTDGHVYLGVDSFWPFGDVQSADVVEFAGPHPAGNVGVQISHIAPVDKGDVVWTLDFTTLLRIGSMALEGHYDSSALVAVVGPEVSRPGVCSTLIGAPVADLLNGRLESTDHHRRIISGSVLTGEKVDIDGYLHFPYRQITVIAEGDDCDEMLGWASMSPDKMSVSRSFPGHFLKRLFRPDARLKGGRRAMIMSGEYDKMMPMDILPEYLIKAILAHDIEGMEQLGIYEVAPEDFALAEYADTSKLPLQRIVREGLDYLRKELE